MRVALLFRTLFLLALCGVVSAQTNETKQTAPKAANKTAEKETADREKARRTQARSLLVSLATDARSFRDQALRARSLARIADALWQADADQAKLLFRKAWEAAEVADQESEQRLQEQIRQQRATSGGSASTSVPPSIRREVLRLAARRDRPLAEEFLERLKSQKIEAAKSATQNSGRLSDAQSQRLGVARELMRVGETERALQFADPVLTVVNIETLSFLCELREKDPAAADSRYLALLLTSSTNEESDGNTVSLLSSYIFTPQLFIIFSASGTSTSQSSNTITPANVSPELKNAFFGAASSILLRPLPDAGQDLTNAGLDAKYLIIRRLLPFFEQSAAAEMVEALRAQMNALNLLVTDNTRRRDDEWITKGIKPDKPTADQEQALLDRIDRAKTSEERDRLYVELGFLAARRVDIRARDFIAKVEDSEIRKQAQAYVDGFLTRQFVQKKQPDQALELMSKGELTHIQKVWILTQCAKQFAKTDERRAADLIEEAATEARRIDVSDPNLPRALLAVANSLSLVDRVRVWDATFDAVKAANSAEGFTGEDGLIVLRFVNKGQTSTTSGSVPDFDVEGIFKVLAIQDYERAVELARGFQAEGPRAVATIAIARAVLEPRPATAVKN